MLVLFDIDGTLIRVGGAGRAALAKAFEQVVGIQNALDQVRLDGRTDLAIIEDAFDIHLRRPPENEGEVERILDAYLSFLKDELAINSERYQVMPGARRMVSSAHRSGRFSLGLATGNVERAARLKLERAELNEILTFGGFGSDSRHREELVHRGIERGQAHSMMTFGRHFERQEILVIGDTELDVAAARAAGAIAIGVLSGCAQREALAASRPDLLVESLEAPELWARIGLNA